MKPEEFTHYVESQLRQNVPKHVLISNLLAGGWTQEQINVALLAYENTIRKESSPSYRHIYTWGEIAVVTFLVLFILATCLFILGSE